MKKKDNKGKMDNKGKVDNKDKVDNKGSVDNKDKVDSKSKADNKGSTDNKDKVVNKIENMEKAVKMELREHKSSFAVYVVLRLLVIIMLILQLLNGNYENVFLCVLTLLLLVVPSFLQVNLRIELPTPLEIILLLFVFAAEILGEIREYYILFPFWDTMLHTLNGFLAAAIGFSLVDILNKDEKFAFKLSPVFMAIVAFCFSMTIGVLWEFFECGMDMFLGFDMQKDTIVKSISTVMLDPNGGNVPTLIKDITSVTVNGKDLGLGGYLDIGLMDTMKDMFVNFIGAVIFSIIGFFYVKKRGKGKFAKRFIPRVKEKNADFLTIIEKEDEKMEQKIKVVIFDIGKVLVDFNYASLIKSKIQNDEIEQRIIRATVDSDDWKELDLGILTEKEILQLFIENDPAIENEIRTIFENLEGIIKQRNYAVPWIRDLKAKGYRVYYLSNFPDKILRECEKEMNFMKETDGGILSYRDKVIKPDPAIYKLLMNRFQIKPEESVFIDDCVPNVEAARELGMHAIQFTSHSDALEKLNVLGVE